MARWREQKCGRNREENRENMDTNREDTKETENKEEGCWNERWHGKSMNDDVRIFSNCLRLLHP
jgi:hypothetical protein